MITTVRKAPQISARRSHNERITGIMSKRARGIMFAFGISITMWAGIIFTFHTAVSHNTGVDLSTTASVK